MCCCVYYNANRYKPSMKTIEKQTRAKECGPESRNGQISRKQKKDRLSGPFMYCYYAFVNVTVPKPNSERSTVNVWPSNVPVISSSKVTVPFSSVFQPANLYPSLLKPQSEAVFVVCLWFVVPSTTILPGRWYSISYS